MSITSMIISRAKDWEIRMVYKVTTEGLKWVKDEVTGLMDDQEISPKILAKKLKSLDCAFNRYLTC